MYVNQPGNLPPRLKVMDASKSGDTWLEPHVCDSQAKYLEKDSCPLRSIAASILAGNATGLLYAISVQGIWKTNTNLVSASLTVPNNLGQPTF